MKALFETLSKKMKTVSTILAELGKASSYAIHR